MGEESDGKPRLTLDKLHLFVTIAIAVLGSFISWQQHQISSWIDQQEQELERRKTITEQSTALLTRTKDYLDSIVLDADKKRRVMISLLEIEKELRVSRSGELSDTAVNALPYHIALLAGDDEALAHIGAGAEALDLWVPIAKTSADIKVREAAIKALRNVALLTNDVEALRTCVDSIIELTQRWNVVELRTQASEAITTIADAYRTEGGDSAEINAILGGALRELEGAVAVATVPPAESPGATMPPTAHAEASDISREQTFGSRAGADCNRARLAPVLYAERGRDGH